MLQHVLSPWMFNEMLLKYVITFPYFDLLILNLYLRVLGNLFVTYGILKRT